MPPNDRTGDRPSATPVGNQLEQFATAWGRASNHLANSVLEANRATMALFGVDGRESDPEPESVARSSEEWEYERSVDSAGDITVGDWVRFSKTIDDADVTAFASASGDTNRLHLEEDFAARTRFGGRIAHGTLVSGLISAALARLPGLTIYLSQDVEFVGPVEIGSRLTAVVEVTENLGADRYRLSTDVLTEEGETVVSGEAVVLVDSLSAGDDASTDGPRRV